MAQIKAKLVCSTILTITSLVGITTSSNATTLVGGGKLELDEFSHIPQEIEHFQSAFAYIATKHDFTMVMSDPPFVTGIPFIVDPSVPQIPATFESFTNQNSVQSEFIFDSVFGQVSGNNSWNYSDNSEQLQSTNLNSESSFTVKDLNHAVWTVGQSGFQASFDLATNETFSFDFDSWFAKLQASNFTDTHSLAVKQSHVIYFYAQPQDINFEHAILMFPLYPNLEIAANDSRIDVGLLGIFGSLTSEADRSLKVSGNGSPHDFSDYFYLDSATETDNIVGTFEYVASQPTKLTVVGYTSSEAVSTHTSVPEPSVILPLFGAAGAIAFTQLKRKQ